MAIEKLVHILWNTSKWPKTVIFPEYSGVFPKKPYNDFWFYMVFSPNSLPYRAECSFFKPNQRIL